jgi:hypothetical protein
LVALLRNRLSLIYHELTHEATVYRVFEVLGRVDGIPDMLF